jgi:hypothetical protein
MIYKLNNIRRDLARKYSDVPRSPVVAPADEEQSLRRVEVLSRFITDETTITMWVCACGRNNTAPSRSELVCPACKRVAS